MAEHAELLASALHLTPAKRATNINIEHDRNKCYCVFSIIKHSYVKEPVKLHLPLDLMLSVSSLVTMLAPTPSVLKLSWD